MEAHQKLFGCFGNKGTRPWEMPCPTCIGYIDKNCPTCNGTQWIDSYECINSVQNDGGYYLPIMFDAIHALKTYHVLPYAGGWLDQPEIFRQIHTIFDHVEVMVHKRKESRKSRLQSMAGKKA